ncbi:hypothetical protein EI74_0540 [Mycoplasma testudineum]|uniref:Uncharacterized protein n=1 Tax=Mycoplasma testudineum TaxID=244584 RepID=A0A4R6IE09_9MOLU|nr:hypothetical protein [Mycoplasma testudineum]OYD26765.1 hypothetical protein CG473_02305 [Mycoplasma testudineum]TDO19901.1 hypothetical protein EI74_0540 [Mycoplasma testudineum]
MAIKTIDKNGTMVAIGDKIDVIVGIKSEESTVDYDVYEQEIYELEIQKQKNKQMYLELLQMEAPKLKEKDLVTSREVQFLQNQEQKYIDLYTDAKKYSAKKLVEFIDFYRMNINDVKAFHFVISNHPDFNSWFKYVSEYTLLKRASEVFHIMADKLSTQRGFDIFEKWLLDALSVFRNFLRENYIQDVHDNYLEDWKQAKIKYTKFLEDGGIATFRFKSK